jgi:Ferritin-like domain
VSDQLQNEIEAEPAKSGLNRRMFLGGAGAVGAALVLAACGGDDGGSNGAASSTTTGAPATTTAPTTTSGAVTGDALIVSLAAGLEALAVGTYSAALDAATAGKLGEVPPAVATFVTTARDHHQAALDAWNGVITGSGGKPITEPLASLKPTVDEKFAKVTDVTGAAQLALELEQIAAATYLAALPEIADGDAVQMAGSIQIIDMQHAAILHFVLGEYPVPDVFARVDQAVQS